MLRSLVAALLVLVLVPAVAAANASAWASRSVHDQATFSEVVVRALDTPEAKAALAEQLAPVLFDSLVAADERARLILGPLAGQAPDASDAAIIRGLEPRIRAALDNPRIEAARDRVVIAAHGALIGLDDPASTVRIEDDALIVDAADLLRAVLDAVEPRLGGLGVTIPRGTSVDLELASSPGLAAVGQALPAVDRLGTILPLVAIATALLVVVMAHRRARALSVVGFAVAIAGAACLAVVWLGGVAVASADSPVNPTLVRSTYDALSGEFVTQSLALVVVGLALLVLGGLSGLFGRGSATRRSAR